MNALTEIRNQTDAELQRSIDHLGKRVDRANAQAHAAWNRGDEAGWRQWADKARLYRHNWDIRCDEKRRRTELAQALARQRRAADHAHQTLIEHCAIVGSVEEYIRWFGPELLPNLRRGKSL